MPGHKALQRIRQDHRERQQPPRRVHRPARGGKVVQNIPLCILQKGQVADQTEKQAEDERNADRPRGDLLPVGEGGLLETFEHDEAVVLADEGKRHGAWYWNDGEKGGENGGVKAGWGVGMGV